MEEMVIDGHRRSLIMQTNHQSDANSKTITYTVGYDRLERVLQPLVELITLQNVDNATEQEDISAICHSSANHVRSGGKRIRSIIDAKHYQY